MSLTKACWPAVVQRGEGGVDDARGRPRSASGSPAALARKSTQALRSTQLVDRGEVALAARDQRRQPADRLGPAQPVERVLDRQHRGRVDGLALEDALDQLAALGQPEQLGQRPGGLDSSPARSTARGDSTSMPCCASPPSTFCQDQVTTSSLGQGSSMAKAAEVASQRVRPGAVVRDPVAIGHPHARGGAVPAEHHVAVPDRPRRGRAARHRARSARARRRA